MKDSERNSYARQHQRKLKCSSGRDEEGIRSAKARVTRHCKVLKVIKLNEVRIDDFQALHWWLLTVHETRICLRVFSVLLLQCAKGSWQTYLCCSAKWNEYRLQLHLPYQALKLVRYSGSLRLVPGPVVTLGKILRRPL